MPGKVRKTSWFLKLAAVLQAANGILISGGCLCEPHLRRMGFLLALGMAAAVTANLLAAMWARRRPRAAATAGIVLQFLIMGTLAYAAVGPTQAALFGQAAVALVVVAAWVVSRRA